MSRTILVTGAAGFIGRNLCATLANDDAEIIALDNFKTSTEKVKPLLSPCEWIRHDVRDPFEIPCDEIYHLACPASPPRYQDDPIYTIETAVKGTINAFRCAESVGARILFASSSEIYGQPLETPQREEMLTHFSPMGPRACYDGGKALGEAIAECFCDDGVETRIARIFNTYGPGMDPEDGRVVSNFVTQALEGEPMTVYGDGSQTRSLCYVSDLVSGLIRLMEIDIAEGAPVNLGNPSEMSILELARKIRHMTNSESEIVHEDLPKNDPTRRCPDISVARVLGWAPKIPVERGLELTINYFRSIVE